MNWVGFDPDPYSNWQEYDIMRLPGTKDSRIYPTYQAKETIINTFKDVFAW